MSVPWPRAAADAGRAAAFLTRLHRRRQGCGDSELDRLLRQVERERVGAFERLMSGPRSPAASEPERQPSSSDAVELGLHELVRISEALVLLRFAKPDGFRFSAGQTCKLELDGVRRTYSIASAPSDPVLEFFVELQEGGQMSSRLAHVRPGAIFRLGPPKGRFGLMEGFQNHVMVATVTGISPFRSIVKTALKGANSARFFILHGASYQDEFGFADELADLARAHPAQLLYRPTVSRPLEARNQGWSGQQGRVEAVLAELVEQYALTPADTALYACGHPQMVAGVAADYAGAGFKVATESY